jgi:Arylsulfotransferase (ASST)
VNSAADTRLSRGRFLAAAGAFVGALALPISRATAAAPAPAAPANAVFDFVSRPGFAPPVIEVKTALPSAAPGYVLLAPATGPSQFGPLIVDETGEPIWFRPLPIYGGLVAQNFRVQEYLGKPVLTWWEGRYANGFGEGTYYVFDTAYKEVAQVSAGNGLAGDLHEFLVTPNNTALISAYNSVPTDLSAYGGPVQGQLLEGVVQEIDIASGAVLFEWHSSDHVAISESYLPQTAGLWDYFHLNSIDETDDGNILISARHTSTVYKLDRSSGDILWRLGGMNSDFAMGDGTRFAYQHDARDHGNGVVTIFDDGAFNPVSAIEPASRAITLQLDTNAMTAELTRADVNPSGVVSFAEGNAQVLDDGGMFVGWGTNPEISEFAADGTLRFDAVLAGGGTSYRAFRAPWSGTPSGPPNLTARPNADGSTQLFVSWNGATDLSDWQIHGGETRGTLRPLLTTTRTGFETSIRIEKTYPFLAAVALDAKRRTLASSRVVKA